MLNYVVLFALAAIGSLALTPLVSRLAVAIGALDTPGERRVHTRPTPRLGGLALYLAMVFAIAAVVLIDASFFDAWHGHQAEIVGLMAAASLILLLGIVDDSRTLGPGTKLVVQIAAAIVLVVSGYEIEKVFGVEVGGWGIPLTLLWVVGITNAFNLIDGLDGLAAGVGLIVSATLLSVSLFSGRVGEAMAFALLAGALSGFLRYNFHPARIFLGDSGSLLIGFLLAAISIQMSYKLSATVAILVPLLALGLPIVDTALTVVRRLMRRLQVARRDESQTRYEFLVVRGSPLFSADRRHIHHRLLDLGLTHRNAVLALYGVSVLFGVGAFLLVAGREPNHALLLASFGIAAVVGVQRLNYDEMRVLRNGTLLPILGSPLFNRRFLQVFLDLLFILLAQSAAFLLWTEGSPTTVQIEVFRASVPLTTFIQIAAFIAAGVYRGAYRYAGLPDVVRIVKATGLAVMGSLLGHLVVTGGVMPPLAPILLDGYVLLTLVAGSRIAFRFVSYASRGAGGETSRRVLFYGAGEAGVAALHELETNKALGMEPVGFLDDNPERRGQLFRGYVIHGPGELDRLISERAFDEVVITSRKISTEQVRWLGGRCLPAGINVRRFSMDWPELLPGELSDDVDPTADDHGVVAEPPRVATG